MSALAAAIAACSGRHVLVDWGTSSLRCYLVDESGAVTAEAGSGDHGALAVAATVSEV